MGIDIKNMKQEIAKSGGSKRKVLFIKDGGKRRIRFLVDFEQGMSAVFHDSFVKSINCICEKELGKKKCKFCGNDDLRTRQQYIWPVYDYDANEVKLLVYAVNNCTPIPSLISMYENYGTITDRDYVIERKGSVQNTTYSVVPMDKAKFRSKVKVPSKDAILKLLEEAFSPDVEVVDDDDDMTIDYDYIKMSSKELYQLCKERGLDPRPKKSAEYYIDLLEKLDDEEGANEDDDDWDDNDEDEDIDDIDDDDDEDDDDEW